MKVTFSDKKSFLKFALKKHYGLIAMMVLFLIVGVTVMYIGAFVVNDSISRNFLVIFGGIFVLASLWLGYTIIESCKHYYEQALTKKYGKYTLARVVEKKSEEHNFDDSSILENDAQQIKKEVHRFVTYAFGYQEKTYTNTFVIDNEEAYNALALNTEIPIQFLSTNPKKSSVREQKLFKELGVKKK